MNARPGASRALIYSSRQARGLVLAAVIPTALACLAQIFIGADPLVVCIASLTFMLSICPIAVYGFLNLGAVLIALVGFRYVGFPIFAKLAMGQPLDSNLADPRGSFLVVLVGVIGYLAAFAFASKLPVGRPILRPTDGQKEMGLMTFLAGAVGMAASAAIAMHAGEKQTGATVAVFFVPFLYLALICALAKNALESRALLENWRAAMLVAVTVGFAVVVNTRGGLMDTLICIIATDIAFKANINWKQLAAVASAIVIMVVFITPVFLYVRTFRSNHSWRQMITLTWDTATDWQGAVSHYLKYTQFQASHSSFFNYYGAPENVFERMSLVNHVDIAKDGADTYGRLGARYLLPAIEQPIPRFLHSNKLLTTFDQGYLMYGALGLTVGPFATLPIIGEGYADFGWLGAFCLPLALGSFMLLAIKKVSGFQLHKNIWAVFFLVLVNNQFVEGSSATYVVLLLRTIPQDLVVIWLLGWFSGVSFVKPLGRKGPQLYGRRLPHTHL